MTILIVDDEDSTREALRMALSQIGQKTVVEARNGDEALKILDSEKNRIGMIISDWEMPFKSGVELADAVHQRPEFIHIPFLLITSDLTTDRKEELRTQHQRIDHFLMKPFRSKVLNDAIGEACKHSAMRRDGLLFLGTLPPNYTIALDSAKSKGLAFQKTASGFDFPGIAGIIVDADLPDVDLNAASAFKKTPIGQMAPWVCLGRGPSQVQTFRSLCQVFVDKSSIFTTENWFGLLEKIHKRLINGFQIDSLSLEIKPLIQQKKFDALKKLVGQLVELDPFTTDGHIWAADIQVEQGSHAKALDHYRAAIEVNPALPRAYLGILEIDKRKEAVVQAALEAEKYCPNSQDVLLAAASALESFEEKEISARLRDAVEKKKKGGSKQ